MPVEQFLDEFHGDLDLANEKLVGVNKSAERMYDSPPKAQSKKKRKITRKNPNDNGLEN